MLGGVTGPSGLSPPSSAQSPAGQLPASRFRVGVRPFRPNGPSFMAARRSNGVARPSPLLRVGSSKALDPSGKGAILVHPKSGHCGVDHGDITPKVHCWSRRVRRKPPAIQGVFGVLVVKYGHGIYHRFTYAAERHKSIRHDPFKTYRNACFSCFQWTANPGESCIRNISKH